MKEISWPHDPNSLPSISQPQIPPHRSAFSRSGRNVFPLLAQREISPRLRYTSRRLWGEGSKLSPKSSGGLKREAERDAMHGLFSWVEAESLRHLKASYCPLVPPPRSTIAAAFSPDGRTLASTHGDHTVKIINCQTGSCLKVLSGHRRTPWVVRFHPLCPEILASGSLDHEVRLWDANTSDCIGSRDFYRPIASIAFHAKGDILAVASGHKLYMWLYNKRGEGSSPTMVLRTRRSLRAVHFHPHGAPFLLTAEVNDIDSSDSSMTRATSPGYLHYPPPAVFLTNIHSSERLSLDTELHLMSMPFLFLPSYGRSDSTVNSQHETRHACSGSGQMQSSRLHLQQYANSLEHNDDTFVESSQLQLQPCANAVEQNDEMVCPMETSPAVPSSSFHGTEDTISSGFPNALQSVVGESSIGVMESTEMPPVDINPHIGFAELDPLLVVNNSLPGVPGQISNHTDLPSRDPACWELPFLQGWLMGQSQAGLPTMVPPNGSTPESSSKNYEFCSLMRIPDPSAQNTHAAASSVALPFRNSLSGVSERSNVQNRFPRSRMLPHSDSMDSAALDNGLHDGNDAQTIISRIQAELAAAAAAELPCTVKLRLWSHDVKNPCAFLHADRCRLTIPHAVLCSEMGAHFSPCGRFLAACVACTLPHMESDPGIHMQIHYDATGAPTSPTRHPISAHQVIYELRIYSLEEATFGSVLVSRAIRAAHCLTSIQFSPTSEHILLAYGRRHSSLLKSIVIDGETTMPIYTILEIYRVSDMELVRVLPSAEDEVNVACFHPLPGGGLVYGTKEGKLRILQYDGSLGMNVTRSDLVTEENMVELQTHALEG